MKYFFRLVLLNMVVFFSFCFANQVAIQKPSISDLTISESFLMVWAVISMSSFLFWWGYLFYHWGMTNFNNRNHKKLWLAGLIIGTMFYFTGPLSYYILVYEMKKGIKLPVTE